jgi:hypothetical protein
VITLTVGANVDAHDYRASTLRRIAAQVVARLCKPTGERKGSLVAPHSEFAVDASTERGSPLDSTS